MKTTIKVKIKALPSTKKNKTKPRNPAPPSQKKNINKKKIIRNGKQRQNSIKHAKKTNNNKTKPKYDKSTECNYMYNVQTIDLNTIFITGGFKEFSSLYPQHCRCQSKLPTSCTLDTPDNAHKQVITHPGD